MKVIVVSIIVIVSMVVMCDASSSLQPPTTTPAPFVPAAGTSTAMATPPKMDGDTMMPVVDPHKLSMSPHSYGKVLVAGDAPKPPCTCLSQPVCHCRPRFAELRVDVPPPPAPTAQPQAYFAAAGTSTAMATPPTTDAKTEMPKIDGSRLTVTPYSFAKTTVRPRFVQVAPTSPPPAATQAPVNPIPAGTASAQAQPQPMESDLQMPDVNPQKLVMNPQYHPEVKIAGVAPCACSGQPSCGCAPKGGTPVVIQKTVSSSSFIESQCGCVKEAVCPCRPDTIAPELVDNPKAIGCGCPVCPCANPPASATPQSTFVTPEFKKTAPCACAGKPSCPCTPPPTLSQSCPCIGSTKPCACWQAPEMKQ